MIEYTTLNVLRQFGEQLPAGEKTLIVERARRRSPHGATFLSHSSADVEFLPALVKILESHGAIVYIDKIDPALPPYTSRSTAQALRDRITQSRNFILFATKNSKDSRWVPWELGLADGINASRRTAVFPDIDMQGEITWTNQEYLGVYDRVVYGDLKGYSKKVWMVLNQQENTAYELSTWLSLQM